MVYSKINHRNEEFVQIVITIRTRSSKNFGSIGDDAADLNSSLFNPCQIPSKAFFIDLPCRVGDELGDVWQWWCFGTDKYSFDVSDIDDIIVGLLLLSNANCKWLGREWMLLSIVSIGGDDWVATSRRTLGFIKSECREDWVEFDEILDRDFAEGERERDDNIDSSAVELVRIFVATDAVVVTVGTLSCTAASNSALRIELVLLWSDEYILYLKISKIKQ